MKKQYMLHNLCLLSVSSVGSTYIKTFKYVIQSECDMFNVRLWLRVSKTCIEQTQFQQFRLR